MTDSRLTRWPSAPKIDPKADNSIRSVSQDEIKEILDAHWLYLETDRKQGVRAHLGSTDLSGMDFTGMNLRLIRMDHAVLEGANLSHANLRGPILSGQGFRARSLLKLIFRVLD